MLDTHFFCRTGSSSRGCPVSSPEAVERALALVGGNRRTAAERLGIGLRTLHDKLKRYGLE